MTRSRIFAAAFAGAIALLGACEDPAGPPAVAAVTITAGADSVAAGNTLRLNLELTDRWGGGLTGRAAEWSSDNPAVAQVDGSGTVTGRSVGSARIIAAAEGKADTFAIRVVPAPVARVDVGAERMRLYAGQTIQLAARAFDAAGQPVTGRPILWATDDSTRASVTQTGKLTVHRAGQLGVSATIGGVFGLIRLELYASLGHVWPDTVALLPGTTRALRARAFSTGGEPMYLDSARWESSNPAVARVDASGQVTAVAAGEAQITAVLGTNRFPAAVNVVPTSAPLRFTSVGMGVRHGCGLTADGQAYCWGGDESGQLATEQRTDRCESVVAAGKGSFYRTTFHCSAFPVAVAGGLRFTSLSVGDWQNCGLTAEGVVYCWGGGTLVRRAAPTRIQTPAPIRTLVDRGTCGLTAEGRAYCWSDAASNTATAVPGDVTFQSLSGSSGLCGLAPDGAAYCWGRNIFGEVGDGTEITRTTPVAVTGGLRFREVLATGFRACGLDTAGKAYCWGKDAILVNGLKEISTTPVPVTGNMTFARLVVSDKPCAMTADGRVYCWETTASAPVLQGPNFPARSFTEVQGNACAIAMDGIAYCAGVRWQGQSGTGVIDSQVLGYLPVARQ